MEASIAENKRQHGALGNVSFLVADVTELQQARMHGFCWRARAHVRVCMHTLMHRSHCTSASLPPSIPALV